MNKETSQLKTFSITAEQRQTLTELCNKSDAFSQDLRAFLQRINEDTPPKTDEAFILPPDIAQKVLIETTSTELVLRPKSYLGNETFRTLLSIVKKFHGRYVSNGKNSYFAVPKPKDALR